MTGCLVRLKPRCADRVVSAACHVSHAYARHACVGVCVCVLVHLAGLGKRSCMQWFVLYRACVIGGHVSSHELSPPSS